MLMTTMSTWCYPKNWGHADDKQSVPDVILKQNWGRADDKEYLKIITL